MTEFRCSLPYNTTNLSYRKYKNTNTIRCHGSKVTTPRRGDQVSSIFNHGPNVLYSQTNSNQDDKILCFLRINYQSRFKKQNNTHLLTVETTHQVNSFQKHSLKPKEPGFLKPNSPLTPLGHLLLQCHQRADCCRAGMTITPHHTRKLPVTRLQSKMFSDK